MQTITPLPDAVLKDKSTWIDIALKILNHYDQDRSAAGIGICIDAWKNKKDVVETEMIDALGFLFGELLIEKHGGEWVFVKDQWGAIPAIRKTQGSMVTYVIDSVSKRLNDECQAVRELPSIENYYATSS